jgi:hypothetical protein
MEQAISTAPEPTRSRDEIVDDIVRELGDARGESLTENDIRAEVMSLVSRLTAGARKGSREQRRAEADHAQSIDGLLAELELRLADPLAPRFNKQLISAIGQMREACRRQMLFRPKGGREVDHLKRFCASSAFYLMQKLRRTISGSAETSFPVVTALLYEAASGERDANCKRAYEHVLRHRRE